MRLASTKRDLNGRELVDVLISAASAVQHGRHQTARMKIETAYLNVSGGVGKTVLLVSQAESDTIVAALRLWTSLQPGQRGMAESIADDNGDPLTNQQADDLGDRINA